MPKLTKSLVEAVEPDLGRTFYLWDSQLGGFGVKVNGQLSDRTPASFCLRGEAFELGERLRTAGGLHIGRASSLVAGI